jgi:hypothetical protein
MDRAYNLLGKGIYSVEGYLIEQEGMLGSSVSVAVTTSKGIVLV